MKIYNYDHITNEYLDESIADESPLEEGVYLIPSYSTQLKPMEVGTHEIACFEEGNWVVKQDFRNETYHDIETKQIVTIDSIGTIPSNLVKGIPSTTNTPESKTIELILEELRLQHSFLEYTTSTGIIKLNSSDITLGFLEKAYEDITIVSKELLLCMTYVYNFLTMTKEDYANIISEVTKVRKGLHDQTITYLEEIKSGNLDFTPEYTIRKNGV